MHYGDSVNWSAITLKCLANPKFLAGAIPEKHFTDTGLKNANDHWQNIGFPKCVSLVAVWWKLNESIHLWRINYISLHMNSCSAFLQN